MRWPDCNSGDVRRGAGRSSRRRTSSTSARAEHPREPWFATNELLIERQWRIAGVADWLPRSTGNLGELLAPLRRRGRPLAEASSRVIGRLLPVARPEWHPTKNALRPDQVTRVSGREITWLCEKGHEWQAVVYARTLSKSGCPTCYRLETSERIKAGKQRARRIRDEQATVQLAAAIPADQPAAANL